MGQLALAVWREPQEGDGVQCRYREQQGRRGGEEGRTSQTKVAYGGTPEKRRR